MDEILKLNTLNDFIRYFISSFGKHQINFGHGCDNAYDEAIWLLSGALHLPSDKIEMFSCCQLLAEEKKHLQILLNQRCIERLPTAYILGEAWLHGFRFQVNQQVIIPRSFIAEKILNDELMPWLDVNNEQKRILDLCCGSACLAIIAAEHFVNAVVDAVDISPAALEIAQINIDNYHLQQRVRLHNSDLFQQLIGKKYDLIISNPPYVDSESMANLPKEYRHEPQLALASGEDGLDIVRQILTEACEYLNEDGILVVEIGHQREKIELAYPELPLVWLETPGLGDVFLITKGELLDYII